MDPLNLLRNQNIFNGINLPLILLAVSICFYVAYVFAILYHLIRFGIGAKPKLTALIFFAGSVLLLMIILGTYNVLDIGAIASGLEKAFGQNIKDFFFFNGPRL
jgi:hypothetical protein